MLTSKDYERIFREFYSGLVNFALYYLKEKSLAEEAVQDVFLKIWEKSDTFKAEISWKSYLFRAVKNRCLNMVRDQKFNVELEEVFELESPEIDPQHRLESMDFEQKVNWIIGKLPERCRMVFLLRKREAMTNREVAELMGISEKTAENQMTNALKILTNYLKK